MASPEASFSLRWQQGKAPARVTWGVFVAQAVHIACALKPLEETSVVATLLAIECTPLKQIPLRR